MSQVACQVTRETRDRCPLRACKGAAVTLLALSESSMHPDQSPIQGAMRPCSSVPLVAVIHVSVTGVLLHPPGRSLNRRLTEKCTD